MKRLLIWGATGRTGSSVLRQLLEYEHIQVTAAIRIPSDISRLPKTELPIQTAIVDINSPTSLRDATANIDIIINAIRLRENIPPTALIELNKRIREASGNLENRLIVTVGGAGSLYMENGKRFWQNPAFPKSTLPRGVAHAKLRDYLKEIPQVNSWTYLIPPPTYIPTGPRIGSYNQWKPRLYCLSRRQTVSVCVEIT
ncbi:MAG TPA: NAD(P)H-binding protein [Methylomusa anaerophila]|uniref:NAD(P)-binding domain-containing protein n=1 Tax=Methylomusa anaerophila TaxID=1930071 RepID=A0A348AN80_9FIRM|nr:NAD(P)H-binding protein [Methylomusa anaerophila]BBB92528.1 hypothetical protein MAMMFC1_03223 [Methylomusa anaerophila]HML87618.1 NAD(P)H-binding protein [Methylomusa anaerophila]